MKISLETNPIIVLTLSQLEFKTVRNALGRVKHSEFDNREQVTTSLELYTRIDDFAKKELKDVEDQ